MNAIKKLALRMMDDTDFSNEVLKRIVSPNVLELDPKKKYILLLDSEINKDVERAFAESLRGFDIVLITDAKAKLLELTMEDV